jgi:hypothetical protein
MAFQYPGIWGTVQFGGHYVIDYPGYAANLKIINVYEKGNPTGHVTPPVLWSEEVVPGGFAPKGGLIHGTVDTNTIPYFTGGSVADGRMVCAHYLIPKDDYTVYKMIPDGKPCAHAGPSRWMGFSNLNNFFYGFELENKQDGQDPFTSAQHIKLALIWAYLAARDKMSDLNLTTHAQVALPPGRRSDPLPAGPFSITHFGRHLAGVRDNWPASWGLTRWFDEGV